MQINGPLHVHASQPLSQPHAARAVSTPQSSPSAPIRDELQISSEATLLEQLRALPDIRQDRVSSLRSQIAEGSYFSEEKLNTAVERLLDEIA